MSERWLLFCEADADFRTATTLIDDLLRLRCGAWVADLYDQDPALVRGWERSPSGAQWFDLHGIYHLATALGIRLRQGHFAGRPGEAGALMLDTMLRVRRELARRDLAAGPIGAIVVVWDMDQQGAQRRAGLAQALNDNPLARDTAVVLGCPDPKREAWILAGFLPEDAEEVQRLLEARRELGFAPHEEPHRLLAGSAGAKREAKRVLERLLHEGGWERERRCLRVPDEEARRRLATHGAGCGLEAFLRAVEQELAPRVDPAIAR